MFRRLLVLTTEQSFRGSSDHELHPHHTRISIVGRRSGSHSWFDLRPADHRYIRAPGATTTIDGNYLPPPPGPLLT